MPHDKEKALKIEKILKDWLCEARTNYDNAKEAERERNCDFRKPVDSSDREANAKRRKAEAAFMAARHVTSNAEIIWHRAIMEFSTFLLDRTMPPSLKEFTDAEIDALYETALKRLPPEGLLSKCAHG